MKSISENRPTLLVIGVLQRKRLGIKQGDEIRLLDRPVDELPIALSSINNGEELFQKAKPIPSARIAYHAPLCSTSRIFCVGRNYGDHASEMQSAPPEHPSIFSRNHESLVGHDAPLTAPKASNEYDFEGEVALMIGAAVDAVSPGAAANAIGGYTLFMDGSVRDYQRHSLLAGKNFRGSGAVGAGIIPAAEIPDPQSISLETFVNGEPMQSGKLADLIFSIPYLISYLSRVTPLKPGDLISTGTPSGVGMARTPPRWLKPGDVIKVQSPQIGVLQNTVY